MKFLKLFLTVAFIFMFIASARADVIEQRIVHYGVLRNDGSSTQTDTPVNNVNVIGFVCSSANCSSVSTQLWSGAVLTTPSDMINVTYPKNLQSQYGYGIYYYKDGYVPYEVLANWEGNGVVGPYTAYLRKAETCFPEITDFYASIDNLALNVSAKIYSPLLDEGNLKYIPDSLKSQYSVKVNITMTSVFSSQKIVKSQIVEIPFSDFNKFTYAFPSPLFKSANVSLTAQAVDSKCLSSIDSSVSKIAFWPGSPGNQTNQTNQTNGTLMIPSISNLHLTNKSTNLLSWSWTNPSSAIFDKAIIYFDGINVLNTSSHSYTADNLLPNSTHTISILTKDILGNINTTAVSDTQTTLSLQNNQTNETDITPPPSISNLTLKSVTENTLLWEWINPSDSDFSKAIIYFDGINVLNTTSNSYLASGLSQDSQHTITIYTIDFSGNINNTPVSSTGRTLKHTSNDGGNSGGGSSGRGNGPRLLNYYNDLPSINSTPIVFEEPSPIVKPAKKAVSSLLIINMILLALLVILLILIILLSSRR